MILVNEIALLELDADEAYLKTKKANDEKSNAVERFLSSTITAKLLINFINTNIAKAIKRGDFQIEIEEKDLSGFSDTFDILTSAAIILCNRQNYRAKVKVNGSLFISWKSPASTEIISEEKEAKPFVFHRPDELNIK